MDKATEDRLGVIIDHYREVPKRLGVSLQELLILVLSEQLRDLSDVLTEKDL